MLKVKNIVIFVGLILVSLLPSLSSAEVVKIGFIGGRNPGTLIKQWSPLVDYLTRETGLSFEIILRDDYSAYVEALENGELDLLEGGALSYVTAAKSGKAKLLVGEVRFGKPTYRTVFAVLNQPKNSAINTLSDLRHKRLALTDPLSTSGYLVPLAMIARVGILKPNDFFSQIVLTSSHEYSIEALLEGAVDVVAVGDFFIDLLPEAQKKKIRVLSQSDPVPCGPITIRNNFPVEQEKILEKAYLQFHKRVAPDILKVTEIDGFLIQDPKVFEPIQRYMEEIKQLEPITTAIPYRHIPTVFSERIDKQKHRVISWMGGSYFLLFIILAISAIWMRRRFTTSIGLIIAGICACLTAFFTIIYVLTIFSSFDTYTAKKLSDLKNVNLQATAFFSNTHNENPSEMLKSITTHNVADWARIFHNGIIIASDEPAEIGTYIVDHVRAGTYDRSKLNTVMVLDPVMMGDRRHATLQVGLSFAPVSKMVSNAITIHLITIGLVLFAGLIGTFITRKRFIRPMKAITRAVNNIREGEKVSLEGHTDTDIKNVTHTISRLGKELEEKQHLVDLKTNEYLKTAKIFRPEVIKELSERIHSIESENPRFLKLRKTCVIGQSQEWLRVLRDAAIRARDRDPVVILGPTGSGKTGVASAIHAMSMRHDKPFAEFNCAEFASSDPLVVLGKFFGYGNNCGILGIDKEGQKGILEEFDGGTLFLDEVQLLPMQAQQLLLLPLERRPFNPAAGKGKGKTVNVRFIFATNQSLDDLIHKGEIRTDLLRRIQSRGTINVPPLAEHLDDVGLLAEYFLAECNSASNYIISFSPQTLAILSQYTYDKYNVSELKGIIDQAHEQTIFDKALVIEPKHLSPEIFSSIKFSATSEMPDEIDREEVKEIDALRNSNFNITKAERLLEYASGSKTLTNHLRGIVYKLLTQNNWDINAVAHILLGPDYNDRTLQPLVHKIEDYIAMAEKHVKEGSSDKLFLKLPQKYHPSLHGLIAHLKKK